VQLHRAANPGTRRIKNSPVNEMFPSAPQWSAEPSGSALSLLDNALINKHVGFGAARKPLVRESESQDLTPQGAPQSGSRRVSIADEECPWRLLEGFETGLGAPQDEVRELSCGST
jgi:hypothetical protein